MQKARLSWHMQEVLRQCPKQQIGRQQRAPAMRRHPLAPAQLLQGKLLPPLRHPRLQQLHRVPQQRWRSMTPMGPEAMLLLRQRPVRPLQQLVWQMTPQPCRRAVSLMRMMVQGRLQARLPFAQAARLIWMVLARPSLTLCIICMQYLFGRSSGLKFLRNTPNL